VDDEARLPERVVDPRPFQGMQVHAHADFVDADLLEHEATADGDGVAGLPAYRPRADRLERWQAPK
jgi:hypothetical protein